MNSDTSIFVGCLDDVALVRIEGIATKETSCAVRQYLADSFEHGLRKFIVDLEQCRLIDSTFIGILTGLAGNIAEEGKTKGGVKVIHSNERNTRSICKLGLDNLIEIEREGDICSETYDSDRLDLLEDPGFHDKEEKTDMIIKAHEDLCSANKANYDEFGDVLHFLKKDLDSATNN